MVCTGEFYEQNGNNDIEVNATITATVQGLKALYEKEVAVTFTALTPFLFKNSTTDPFIPDTNMGALGRTIQAGIEVPKHFSSANFDIGHVVHRSLDDMDGWSSGGVAQLSSVCNNSIDANGGLSKASAWSGSYNTNGYDWISLMGHELAHQFSATHTFNGGGGSCEDNIALNSAYEIGSGTTIMSYNGVCQDNNNIPSGGEADLYFHAHSLMQITTFLSSLSCSTNTATNNQIPTVNANPCGSNFEIPRNTPFYLDGEASDPDGDVMYYAWEQYDEDGDNVKPTQGRIGASAAGLKNAPLFRSFPPSTESYRYFPTLSTIAVGNNIDPFQVLPNTDRTLHFKLTARDSKAGGGAFAIDERTVTVSPNGPLTVTSPNGANSFMAGESTSFVWSTNGTNSLCSKVDILLSIDGGQHYDIVVASDVDYDLGTAPIIIPPFITQTSTARMMIKCSDNPCSSFFDTSNSNFTINSQCTAPKNEICPTVDKTFDQGDPGLNLSLSHTYGNNIKTIGRTIFTNSTTVLPNIVFGVDMMGCAELSNFYTQFTIIKVDKDGVYNFAIDEDENNGRQFVSLFDNSTYNSNSQCQSFISSSARDAGGGSFIRTFVMTAQLQACKEYRLIFYNFDAPEKTTITDITGPGRVVEVSTLPTTDYSYTYLAVDNQTNIITAISPVSNFVSLPGGSYTIHGLTYKSGGATPPNITDPANYLGKTFNEFYIDGDCFLASGNSFQLTVNGNCSISSIVIDPNVICDPSNNIYAAKLTVTYNPKPSSGDLNIGGTLFPITTSPQQITLNGQSDGNTVSDQIFFTSEPDCKFPYTYIEPNNCCNFDISLPSQVNICEGETATLDAGAGLGFYEWRNASNIVLPFTSNSIEVTEEGLYSVLVTNPTGCPKKAFVQVNVEGVPSLSLPEDLTICEGVVYNLFATTTASNLEWYKNDTLVVSGGVKNISVTTAGIYKVIAGNSANCSVKDSILITTKPSPKPNLGQDIAICTGDSITLQSNAMGTHEWFFNNTLIANQSNTNLTAKNGGLYKIRVTLDGCPGEDLIILNVNTYPFVDAGLDQNFCEGNEATIDATCSTQSYIWFKDGVQYPATELTFNTTIEGDYVLEASNGNCISKDTVSIEKVLPPSVSLGADITACIGSDVTLKAPIGNLYMYQWYKNGVPLSTDSEITVNSQAIYLLEVTAAAGCKGSDNVFVSFITGPTLDLIVPTQEICLGEKVTLTAQTQGTNLTWLKDGTIIPSANGKTFDVTESGEYTVKVKGDTDCEVEKFTNITVNPVPTVNLGDDKAVCIGETITLSSNVSGIGYNWFQDETPLSSASMISVTAAGTYKLEVRNEFNCIGSDEVKVSFLPQTTLVIPQDTSKCQNQTITLSIQTDGTFITWYKNNVEISGQNGKDLIVSGPGSYKVEVGKNGFCDNNASITVIENPAPIPNLGEDKTLCAGDKITLSANTLGNNYKWSNGELTSSIMVINPGLSSSTVQDYAITVTNNFGCMGTDNISITFLPKLSVKINSEGTVVCKGDSLILTSSGASTYTWSGEVGTYTQLTPNSIIVYPEAPTTYQLIGFDQACASNKDTTTLAIKFFLPSNVSAGEDTCTIAGRPINLNATGGVKYVWEQDPSFIGSLVISNPTVSPLLPTTYMVTITDNNGCRQVETVEVCINEDPLAFFEEVTAITPNGDGMNDELEFIGLEYYTDNVLTIYNRWGNQIFRKKGYQTDGLLFDGTRNGDLLPADTYYYVLEFDGKVIKRPLTIMR